MNTEYLQLSIFVDETDMRGELPLYEVIVRRLLHLNVNGATVFSGSMGYGSHGRVHRQRLFGVSDDRPVAIIAVDKAERIRAVVPEIRQLVQEGLITVTAVEVIS